MQRASPLWTRGFPQIEESDACSQCGGSNEAFLLGNEFAHHHPKEDGGLHLVLPPTWHAAAIERNWAVPHTLAGQATVSRLTLLIFAPRDADERNVVRRLIEVSESFARGFES